MVEGCADAPEVDRVLKRLLRTIVYEGLLIDPRVLSVMIKVTAINKLIG